MKANRDVLTRVHTCAVMVPVWFDAVLYLARRSGQWVASVELGDAVYGEGLYSRHAPHNLVARARKAGVPIESNKALGYRIGRDRSRLCGRCGSMKVRYEGEEVCYGCVGTEFVDLEVGRAEYDASSRQGKGWEAWEEALLRRLWPELSQAEIGARLQRSEASVRGRGKELQLGKKPYRKGVR